MPLANNDEVEALRQRVRQLEAEVLELRSRPDAAAALRESEARYRAAAQGSMDAFLILRSLRDEAGRIIDFVFVELNPQAVQMLTIPKEQVIGQQLCELLPVNRSAGFFAKYVAVVEHNTVLEEEFQVEGFTGSRWIRHQVVPLGDGIAITSRDITQRQEAESALRQSEERFRTLVEDAPIGIAILRAGVILQANQAFLRLFGYESAAAVMGREAIEHVAPEYHDFVRDRMRRRELGDDLPSTYEVVGVRQDGSRFLYSVAVSLITVSDGPAVVVFYSDQTERYREEETRLELERRLLESQRIESLSLMAGGIAHDFNNLLSVIIGNIEIVLLDLPPESPLQAMGVAISAAAQQAARLTRQMLAYSGRGHLAVEQLSLSTLVEEMTLLLQATCPSHVTLTFALDAALPLVEADATQLQQVILNLLLNSVEAIGGTAGRVSIATRAVLADANYLRATYPPETLLPGHYIVVEVRDTGCGMSQETISRIFEPFFTTKFTGRGLGLAAVLGIVRGHGGAVHIASTPGQGTTISLLLPPLAVPQADELPFRLLVRDERRVVLVVDDEAGIRMLVARALSRADILVLTAESVEAALEQFATQGDAFSCVLLDMTMPTLSGEQALVALRHAMPNVPVLMMSGYSDSEQLQRLLDLEVSGFLPKPFSLDELRTQVERAMTTAAPASKTRH